MATAFADLEDMAVPPWQAFSIQAAPAGETDSVSDNANSGDGSKSLPKGRIPRPRSGGWLAGKLGKWIF